MWLRICLSLIHRVPVYTFYNLYYCYSLEKDKLDTEKAHCSGQFALGMTTDGRVMHRDITLAHADQLLLPR